MRIKKDNPVAIENVKFINLVKTYENLYDRNHKHYGKRKFIFESWREISEKTGKQEHVCRKKWTQLRDNFTRAVKHRTKYAYKKALSFLFPHMRSTIKKTTKPRITRKSKIDVLGEFYENIKGDEMKFDRLDQTSRIVLLIKIRGMIHETYKEEDRKKKNLKN